MDLETYFDRPTKAALAAKLNCHPSKVSRWLSGTQVITAEDAVAIEMATNGAVHRSELRPDLWSP